MDDMWTYVALVKQTIVPGFRITVFSFIVFGCVLIIPGVSATTAKIMIPSRSRVNTFDLYNMKDVECGVLVSGNMFRSKNIDITRQYNCPWQVWIYFYSGSDTTDKNFAVRFDHPTHVTSNLKAWMKDKPKSYQFPPIYTNCLDYCNVTLDTGVPGYDFIMRDDNTGNVTAAVYNDRDDVTRPRFFYNGNGLSQDALTASVANQGAPPNTFQEADMMEIRLVFSASCGEVPSARTYNTCAEALDTEYCPCDCAYYDKLKYWDENALPEGMTDEEKKEFVRPEMEATKKQLTVNKTELSSYRNKKISAPDDRSSAKGLGMLGTVTLGLVFGSLVLCDLVSIKRHATNVRVDCTCLKT